MRLRARAFAATAAYLVVTLSVVTLSLSKGVPVRAEGGGWPDLARRIAASFPYYKMNVVVGAEPPRFVFPPAFRPALPVLGSTWRAFLPELPPSTVHVYYVPSPRTTAAAKTLFAALTAAGYVHIPQSGFPDAFVGESGPVQKWCPTKANGPALQVNVEPVGGVPALDVLVDLSGRSTSCGSRARVTSGSDTPVPKLGDIPGMRIYARMRSSGGYENALGSTAIVRTTLSAPAAVAKLAERFTASGWSARPPIVDGTTVVQHFSRVAEPFRWDALLLFDRRGENRYDAMLDVTHAPLPPAKR